MNLQTAEKVSSELDTEEEHRKIFEDDKDEEDISDEEVREWVEISKDRTIRKLGHIQRRIDEVQSLKDAFEDQSGPDLLTLQKTFWTLRSAILLEVMHLCFGNPTQEIFTKGVTDLSEEKATEVTNIRKSLEAYSSALMLGFNVSPFFWSEFPFDQT
jgi:hypothetical protein